MRTPRRSHRILECCQLGAAGHSRHHLQRWQCAAQEGCCQLPLRMASVLGISCWRAACALPCCLTLPALQALCSFQSSLAATWVRRPPEKSAWPADPKSPSCNHITRERPSPPQICRGSGRVRSLHSASQRPSPRAQQSRCRSPPPWHSGQGQRAQQVRASWVVGAARQALRSLSNQGLPGLQQYLGRESLMCTAAEPASCVGAVRSSLNRL